ncbi:MAG: hypothetical protein M5U12_19940 [Verrucomicrobia bacterium]|nr:hypothetical protein [Verrucomicrobiota bacterium]
MTTPVNPSGFGPEPGSLPAPQPVVLSHLEAAEDRGRVLVRWETVWEWGVISYDLLRQVEDRWVPVNLEPVLAVQAMPGGRYHVRDDTLPAARLRSAIGSRPSCRPAGPSVWPRSR